MVQDKPERVLFRKDLVQTCPCMPFAAPGCVIWKGSCSDQFRILLNWAMRAQEMLFESNTNLSACFLERIMLKLVQPCLSQCKVKTPVCVFWKGSCANCLFRILCELVQESLLQSKTNWSVCFLERLQFKLAPACLLQLQDV